MYKRTTKNSTWTNENYLHFMNFKIFSKKENPVLPN